MTRSKSRQSSSKTSNRGRANWQMWLNGYRNADDLNKQIKGYASTTSVNKGGSITLIPDP